MLHTALLSRIAVFAAAAGRQRTRCIRLKPFRVGVQRDQRLLTYLSLPLLFRDRAEPLRTVSQR